VRCSSASTERPPGCDATPSCNSICSPGAGELGGGDSYRECAAAGAAAARPGGVRTRGGGGLLGHRAGPAELTAAAPHPQAARPAVPAAAGAVALGLLAAHRRAPPRAAVAARGRPLRLDRRPAAEVPPRRLTHEPAGPRVGHLGVRPLPAHGRLRASLVLRLRVEGLHRRAQRQAPPRLRPEVHQLVPGEARVQVRQPRLPTPHVAPGRLDVVHRPLRRLPPHRLPPGLGQVLHLRDRDDAASSTSTRRRSTSAGAARRRSSRR
jgi:hypothetical protein